MKKTYLFVIALVAVLGVASFVVGYEGPAPKVVVEGNYIEAPGGDAELGAFPGPDVYQDIRVHGSLGYKYPIVNLANTSIYATTTLRVAESGTNYMLSGSGTTIILPAVNTAGTNFRFTIKGAADVGNYIIDSAEGDNIDGTLIVAGAVVDCRGEDQINFVVDGEQIGDYVELMSNGTQWLIVDSGVLTPAKMTCTDPS